WWHHYLDGIPEYEQIPGQINIRVILRLWTLYRCFDMLAYAQMRYNLLGNAGHWFPGNNAANFDDIQIQNSIPNSPFRNQIPQILREAHSLFFKAPAKRLSKD
ncbi:MAG: aldo/keto reductase, partial [Chthoniobacterales bacterium]|nr:aldo/keto reductase [Chthoniobacterales bacterium]